MKAIGIRRRISLLLPVIVLLAFRASVLPQQLDEASVVRRIDEAVKARFDAVLSFTVIEHYAVYRNNDETHPAAEMTVKTAYSKDTGKSYQILSESGSAILRKYVLDSLLENEKRINQPANRQASWFTSANYEMKLLPGGMQHVDGRDCLALSLKPKDKATNLIDGTLWVDANDYSTVQIKGVATRSPSMFSDPAQVMRQYVSISGFAQAIHARAASSSMLFGPTVVVIDYNDYKITTRVSK